MIEKIKSNIFPAAWPAVEPWRKFRWDRGPNGIRTGQVNSSQALCIDVFGSIKMSPHADVILNAIVTQVGLEPVGGSWHVELEWVDPLNHLNLNEKRRTQVDVVLRNQSYLIFVECKFTEADGGSCSRTIPKREYGGLSECNGNFDWQEDPVRYALFSHFGVVIKDAKCALSRAGIRYWDFIPEVLRLDPAVIYRPCPFNAPLYQWMRNLILCWRVATVKGLRPIFLIVYAYRHGLPMSDRIESKDWHKLARIVRQEKIAFHTISYQEVVRVAASVADSHKQMGLWEALQHWLNGKVESAIALRDG